MVLGALVLYFAGAPLVTWCIAKGNLAITKGAPKDLSNGELNVSKLELTKSTTDESDIQIPELDTRYGTIICERIGLDAPLYYGDSEATLLLGAGQYPNGVLPGDGRPFLIGGHDATVFAPLEGIELGDLIIITTDFGTYQYSVSSKLIADPEDSSVYDLTQEKEQLILYTCYPFGRLIGESSSRFFVFCDPIPDPSTE